MKEEERLLFQPQTYFFTLEKLITNILWRDTLGAQLRVKAFENCFNHVLKKKKWINYLLQKKLWKNRRYVVLIRGKDGCFIEHPPWSSKYFDGLGLCRTL